MLMRVLYDPVLAGFISNVTSYQLPSPCSQTLHTGLCVVPWTTSGPLHWLFCPKCSSSNFLGWLVIQAPLPQRESHWSPCQKYHPLILANHRFKLFRSLSEFECLFWYISNFSFVFPHTEAGFMGTRTLYRSENSTWHIKDLNKYLLKEWYISGAITLES